jgi:hypothetical protein
MSFCPRCVQPVPPDSSNCPHCDYGIASIDASVASAGLESSASPEGSSFAGSSFENSSADSASADSASFDSPLIDSWDTDEPIGPDPNPRPARQRLDLPRPAWPELAWPQWRARLPIVVGVVAVAIALATIVIRPGDHGTVFAINGAGAPSKASSASTHQTPQSGQQQAVAIDGYLKLSATARAGVSNAIVSIGNCQNIADAVATLSKAADTRAEILARLNDAQVSALPGGTAMLANLQQALQASATADRDYAAWGTATAASCSGKAAPTATYTAAQQSDTVATAAKQRFVQSWNTVASTFGLPPAAASTF